MPMVPALLQAICHQHGLKAKSIDLNLEIQIAYEHKTFSAEIESYLMYFTKLSDDAYNWYHDWLSKKADELIKLNSNWLGFSMLSYQSLSFTQDILYYIKSKKPEQQILVGGNGISVWENTNKFFRDDKKKTYADVLIDTGLANAIVINEGETNIIDIISNNKKGKFEERQQITSTQLNELPAPTYIDYKLHDYKKYSKAEGGGLMFKDAAATIIGSKGCVRKCTFCDVATFYPKFVFKSGKKIADEIIKIYETTGVTEFAFADSLINGSMLAFREMNKELAKRLPKTISYKGEYIAKPVGQTTDEDYALMKEAGCKAVFVGVESGSERVRMHMKKKFTNEDLYTMIEKLYEYKIDQSWNLMIGYITETREDFEDTLNLVKKYSHIPFPRLVTNPSSILHLLPGSPIYDLHWKEMDLGWEDVKDAVGFAYDYWTSGSNPENTFLTRCNHFKELLTLCYNIGQMAEGRYKTKMDVAEKMIEHYNKNIIKTKKTVAVYS